MATSPSFGGKAALGILLAQAVLIMIALAIFLPGLFIESIFLFRKNPLGVAIAPPLLVFCIFMDITIGKLDIAMVQRGMGSGFSVALSMGCLVILSVALLITFLKQITSAAP